MIAELKALDIDKMTGEDANRLWKLIEKQDVCFDDMTRGRGDFFASRLVSPTTVSFEYDAGALILIENIVPKLQADIHWFMWKNIPEAELSRVGRGLCREVLDRYQLNRISTYIPSFNKLAMRIATRTGFKYEGCMRQLFLYKGIYHDVFVYGLLNQEFSALGAKT